MTSLAEARAEERRCRETLAALVAEQRAASAEGERLAARAALDEAVPDMAVSAERQSARAAALEEAIVEARRSLRAQEAAVARLEADADGA